MSGGGHRSPEHTLFTSFVGIIALGYLFFLLYVYNSGMKDIYELKDNPEKYTVFLDGRKVAVETLNLSFYNIELDEENGVAYLTRR